MTIDYLVKKETELLSIKDLEEQKEFIRELAVEWQASETNYSYEELVEFESFFKNYAGKFGLSEEFEENGIF